MKATKSPRDRKNGASREEYLRKNHAENDARGPQTILAHPVTGKRIEVRNE